MQKAKIEHTVEYQLSHDNFGNKRKYKLPKKRVNKIVEYNTWIENELKNQWIFKDYRCYYIVISMFKKDEYSVTCSGSKIDKVFSSLEEAKIESFNYCDKLLK